MDPKTAQSLNDFFIAAAIIAVLAVSMVIPSYIVMRRAGQPLCPRWTAPGVPWQTAAILMALFPVGLVGFHAVMAFAAQQIPFDPGEATYNANAIAQLRQIRPAVLVAPAFMALYLAGRSLFGVPSGKGFAQNVLLGIVGWAVLMPLTFAVHFTVLQIFLALGIEQVTHPLTALRPQDDGTGGLLFAVAVCVCTPMVEESLFRGLLVPWAGQRRIFPWVLWVAALLMAALTTSQSFGPLVFVLALGGLMGAFQTLASRSRFPRRTTACIISSSAVFAAAHSAVWPTPIPLFVLACGLGYLTARTRSIVPAIVVHGLFNAVSFVMLCRGSTF